jgi:hypothetical protein
MASRRVRRIAITCLLACLLFADGEASLPRCVAGSSNRVEVLRTSSLRSAYLIRQGVVRYDANNMSPQGVRRQLQQHFDVVIALLMAGTPQHIELALDRLEASRQQSWTVAEREAWRRQLLESRGAQIARLVAYRNRGQFPLNEGQASHAVPIFVDEHDTACAVGQLMRQSGRDREVSGIRDANNLVYVPDVAEGPLVAWTLKSGITLEEAALIQPSYGPILLPKPDDAIEVLSDKASFEFENLRYSNFQIFVGDDAAAPDVNIPVGHVACSWYGCGPTFPIIWEEDYDRVVTLPSDFDLTIRDFELSALDQTPPLLRSFPRVVVQFDVEVTAPNLRIASVPNGGSLLSNSFFDGHQFRLFVDDSRNRLWIDQVHNPIPSIPCFDTFCMFSEEFPRVPWIEIGHAASSSNSFQPTNRMTVVTEMYLPPDQEFRGQFINFSLVAVPEPAAAALAMIAIGLCAAGRRR